MLAGTCERLNQLTTPLRACVRGLLCVVYLLVWILERTAPAAGKSHRLMNAH